MVTVKMGGRGCNMTKPVDLFIVTCVSCEIYPDWDWLEIIEERVLPVNLRPFYCILFIADGVLRKAQFNIHM